MKDALLGVRETAAPPRVLIVDDNELVREMMAAMLEGEAQVETAEHSAPALAALAERDFELVMADIRMPGESGLELLSKIKALKPDTMVVIMSGSQEIESPIEALKRGAFDYITKPFSLDKVRITARRAIEHYRLRRIEQQAEEELERLVEQRTAQLNRMFESLYLNYRATLSALAKVLEARDMETRGHSDRVVAYSLKLGQQLGLDERQMLALEHGALLHDIGKIGVPDAILLKPGPLTSDEWKVMRRHIDHGADIIGVVEFLKDGLPVITQHHEKWDGSGYPQGLPGEKISIYARIFAVADCCDAITSDRPYRRGQPFDAVVKELVRCSGTQFDPRVVDAFLSIPLEKWQQLRETVQSGDNPFGQYQQRIMRSLLMEPQAGQKAGETARKGSQDA